MLKSRDFYLMKVYDLNGKYLGIVEDISIDFNSSQVIGFSISHTTLFKKYNYVDIKSILYIEEVMIVKEVGLFSTLKFKDIKYMDIVNKQNNIIGVLEDLVIDKDTFSIKGLIMSSGIFDRIFKGKDIIMAKSCILCENYILYNGIDTVKLKTLPHNLGGM